MAPLIAAALGLGPALVEVFFGQKAGALADAAAGAIAGTSDLEDIRNLPPDKRAELRITLEQIALQQMQAEYVDRANARDMAGKSQLIARAQVSFAGCILALFATLMLIMLLRGVPADQSGLFYYAMGILSAAVAAVIAFFFGNSTSANSANARMDQIAARAPVLALPAPSSTDDLNERSLRAVRGNG